MAILAILIMPTWFYSWDCLGSNWHGSISELDLIRVLPGSSLDVFPLLCGEGGGLDHM